MVLREELFFGIIQASQNKRLSSKKLLQLGYICKNESR